MYITVAPSVIKQQQQKAKGSFLPLTGLTHPALKNLRTNKQLLDQNVCRFQLHAPPSESSLRVSGIHAVEK